MENTKELAEKVAALSHDNYIMFMKELARISGRELLTAEIKVDKINNFTKN